MKEAFTILFIVLTAQAFGNLLDIFEQDEGHEPRVAVSCDHIAFHADLITGQWISDKKGLSVCDSNKEDVKRYCQKMYPKMNITNIVEANEKVLIKNWCKPGSKQCTIEKEVVPYRCLVDEYEADALMVPKGCKFHHLHDQDSCMTHDEWKMRAESFLEARDMKLSEYGILLACGTDMFTGIEFVGCPKKPKREEHKISKALPIDRLGFEAAIKKLRKFIPIETEGCDRTLYEKKRQKMEERHQSKIAAVVDEWDEAELRYKKLKLQDAKAALNKMKKTVKVFQDTLQALNKEAEEEKTRLKREHAECITASINKQKRDFLIAHLAAVEEKPHSLRKILKTARKFFESAEHDRLHSLRHFQHVQKQDPVLAESTKTNLLQHLQDLNDAVNASINILSYLPDVAKEFGLKVLKGLEPSRLPDIFAKKTHHKVADKILDFVNRFKAEHQESSELKKVAVEDHVKQLKETSNNSKDKVSAGTLNPTDRPTDEPSAQSTDKPTENPTEAPSHHPAAVVTEHDSEGIPENEAMHQLKYKLEKEKKEKTKSTKDNPGKEPKEHLFFKHPKSPAAFAAVIGLSCGALVIMLGSIVALVMRRNRASHSRVVIADAEPEDQEHLVKMQKNGYENPTYKFFYY